MRVYDIHAGALESSKKVMAKILRQLSLPPEALDSILFTTDPAEAVANADIISESDRGFSLKTQSMGTVRCAFARENNFHNQYLVFIAVSISRCQWAAHTFLRLSFS